MKTASADDTKKVLDAVGRGDSIPEGFAFGPGERGGPVFALSSDEDTQLQQSVHLAGAPAIVHLAVNGEPAPSTADAEAAAVKAKAEAEKAAAARAKQAADDAKKAN